MKGLNVADPAPLTPPDCDLQDYPFMPLHVARLRDSDLAAEEDPEACWYAVLLWAASWHQLPAASLPDNDAVLTKLIGLGRDLKTFRKHKAGALRGFVLCADGRLYHPIVAEQAIAGWRGKLEQRWRTECARIKKRNQRDKTDLPLPTFAEFMATLPETSRLPLVPGDSDQRPEGQPAMSQGTVGSCPQGKGIQERETGTGTVEDKEPPIAPQGGGGLFGDQADDDPPEVDEVQVAYDLWNETAKACGLPVAEVLNDGRRKAIGKRLEFQGIPGWRRALAAVEVSPLCRGMVPGRDGAEPWRADLNFVCQAKSFARLVEGYYGTGAPAPRPKGPAVPVEDPWRRRVREFVSNRYWVELDWGPRPGRSGCQVSPEIQREFGIEPAKPQPVDGRAA